MRDRICEFECNIDDMTAEDLAFAAERIMEAGAKDVAVTPIVMKKGRPAWLLTVMCADDETQKKLMIEQIFRHTTTIGIRELISERYVLERSESVVSTPFGDVRCKTVSGYGVSRSKFEYEDLARIARENGLSMADARRIAEEAAGGQGGTEH